MRGATDRWRGLLHVLASIDWFLVGSVCALVSFGLILIYSATFRHSEFNYVSRQLVWLVIGVGVAGVIVAIPEWRIRHYAETVFIVAFCLVVLVYFFGSRAYGAQRWISLFGLRIQPSEFLKVATILMLAKYADVFRERINAPVSLLSLSVITGASFFVILRQPDLGTAMAIMAIAAGIVYMAGVNWVLLSCFCFLGLIPLVCPLICIALDLPVTFETVAPVAAAIVLFFLLVVVVARFARIPVPLLTPLVLCGTLAAGLMLSPVVFQGLNPYQRLRLTSFLQPEADPRGSGYNLIQSMIAIGSGGLTGKGLYQGSQNVLGFLPHKHTDFIFSVLAEELGFWGVVFLMILVGILLSRCLLIASMARSNFGMLVAVGVTCMFAFHFLVNMAMTLGMMPITGLPLSFVSYGGSALVSSLVCVGLVLNVSLRRERFTF